MDLEEVNEKYAKLREKYWKPEWKTKIYFNYFFTHSPQK